MIFYEVQERQSETPFGSAWILDLLKIIKDEQQVIYTSKVNLIEIETCLIRHLICKSTRINIFIARNAKEIVSYLKH